jgi:hypothetical protein
VLMFLFRVNLVQFFVGVGLSRFRVGLSQLSFLLGRW